MEIKRIKWYGNGVAVRVHNKEIVVSSSEQDPNAIILNFKSFDAEDANRPAVLHQCHRGKVKETSLKLSDETMAIVVQMYLQKKRRDLKIELEKEKKSDEKN